MIQKENDELTMKLMDAEKKVVQMERLVAESRDEIERSVALNESNVSRLAELQTVLDQVVSVFISYLEIPVKIVHIIFIFRHQSLFVDDHPWISISRFFACC